MSNLKESNNSDIWVLLSVVICCGHPRFKLLPVEVRECWAQFIENITNSSSHPATMLKLYIAFVRPILEYASFVWAPHKLKDMEMLERVQHFALKISLKRWSGHYSEKLVFAELPTLLFRRNCARVTVLHKILNKLIDFPSGYIEERVTSISYQLRDFQCNFKATFRPRTNEVFHSFFPASIRLYNKLPISTRESTNICVFRRKVLHSIFLSQPLS